MEDTELKLTGSIRVHVVYDKKMGPKTYRMAAVDILDEDGKVVDTGTAFMPDGVSTPSTIAFQFYKNQLGVKLG